MSSVLASIHAAKHGHPIGLPANAVHAKLGSPAEGSNPQPKAAPAASSPSSAPAAQQPKPTGREAMQSLSADLWRERREASRVARGQASAEERPAQSMQAVADDYWAGRRAAKRSAANA